MPRRYRQWLVVGYGLLAALLVTGGLLVVTRRPAGLPVQLQAPPTVPPLRVHVAGAVVAPGVYQMAPGSILQDAVAAAGGPTGQADVSLLNLAHLLTDGEQVLVPESAPTANAASSPSPGTPTTTTTRTSKAPGAALININVASAAELVALPHIGPALAKRIVDYRSAHGRFRATLDLRLVRGIGPTIFEQIKALITVN